MAQANGHEFVEIPGGISVLGAGPLDPFAGERERPMREVYINRFLMARHPTTRKQFAEYLIATGESFTASWWRPVGGQWTDDMETEGDYPATEIGWETAVSYCQWLSTRAGVNVALPTEAEWEKAARGGDDRIWPWGNEFSVKFCRSSESGLGLGSVHSHDGGASPYGCCQMAGGVWEWCEDFYHSSSHYMAAFVDPVNTRPSDQRVVKGGSAYCAKEVVRPTCRDWTNSYNQGGGDDGFRVCARDWR
ncbi:formylglycine-generating enzyme family protein [Micromonospora tarensis]|uniref:SUMF1/EgtB/PvdO family nonheme iron enzyme n=1 Tax=Micromonospora tarensis TaxID=2806100 RepID=A0ABS1YDM6_9ACTN|nr:SUMF1/EgtB/PvdO family nonheme iron enzyme [Micromonospora tarensis]MBM0275490.1 SUMF1/EgtB/PvdO family nonheme iron enzyme [Micromonospora tarensis]